MRISRRVAYCFATQSTRPAGTLSRVISFRSPCAGTFRSILRSPGLDAVHSMALLEGVQAQNIGEQRERGKASHLVARLLWLNEILSGGCDSAARADVMRGGVFNRQSLHSRSALHERAEFGGDFLEEAVVVVADVGFAFPERHAAEFAGGRVERFDIFDESWLRLNARQEFVVHSGFEFGNFRWVDGAGDNTRLHGVSSLEGECPLRGEEKATPAKV